MTALRPPSGDTRARPIRLAAIRVVLSCGALAALGAAAAPVVFVGVLFVPVLMLPLALLLLVVSWFVNAAILRTGTGRRQRVLAVVLALVVPAGVGVELVVQAEIPFGPRFGLPVPLVIGAVAAGVSTCAFPRWGRWVGGLTIVLAAMPLAWQAVSDAAREASATRASEEAAREAMYDAWLPGATTPLTGVETELRALSESSAEVAVDRDGRELMITMSGWGDPAEEDPDAFACWLLTAEESWVEGQTYAELDDRCSIVDGGWVSSDGLAFGTYRDGHWVTVDAGRGATAEDVAEVAETLEDVPEDERRSWWDTMAALTEG